MTFEIRKEKFRTGMLCLGQTKKIVERFSIYHDGVLFAGCKDKQHAEKALAELNAGYRPPAMVPDETE